MDIKNTYNLIDGAGTILVTGQSLQTIYDYLSTNPGVSGTIQQVQQITTTLNFVISGVIH